MKIKGGRSRNEQRSKQRSSNREREINGFPFPSEIIELGIKGNLSTKEAYFLMILLNAMNKKNKTCWKSEKTLATEVRCGRATIERIRNSLEEKGVIEVGKREKWRGQFALNEYKIVYPWPSPCLKLSQAPSIKLSQGALTHFSKSPSIKVSHKSVKRELVNKSISQAKNRTDDDPFLTPKTEEISSENPGRKNKGASLITTPGDRESSAPGHSRDGGFDFGDFVRAYKERKDLDAKLAPHMEEQIESFYEKKVSEDWNKKSAPPTPGMRRLFFRACRDGAGEPFGFVPKSLEQIEEDRKEEERLRREKVEEEERRAKREKQEQAKLEREEKEQRVKQIKLEKFIAAHPVISALLREVRMERNRYTGRYEPSYKEINAESYLNDIMEGSGARNKKELIKACEKQLTHLQRIRKADEKMIEEMRLRDNLKEAGCFREYDIESNFRGKKDEKDTL